MRLKNAEILNVAVIMAPRFSAIVQETGTLTPEQMREAIYKARREGVQVANVSSDRSLQMVNEHYVEGCPTH